MDEIDASDESDFGGGACTDDGATLDTLPHVKRAWKWFHDHGSPRWWAAPLVGLSEPAFRLLCRKNGVAMAHTEMADPAGFACSAQYRDQLLGNSVRQAEGVPLLLCEDASAKDDERSDKRALLNVDRPLVLQLGGSNVAMMVAAAKAAVADGRCDAIELNCGCPQRCARQGGYGAYLLDSNRRDRLVALITALREVLPPAMPLLAKMRVLHDIQDTVTVARDMVAAGVGILTVHGRTRRQGGGVRQGSAGSGGERLASWPHIAAVKRAVPVPVVANGNVRDAGDAIAALDATGCDALMSGCGLLRDPTLFAAMSEGIDVTTIRVGKCVEGDIAMKSEPAIGDTTGACSLSRLFGAAASAQAADTPCEFSCCCTPLSRSVCNLDMTPSSAHSLESGHSDNGNNSTHEGDVDVRSGDDGVEGDEAIWQAGVNIACEYLDLVAVHGAFPTQMSKHLMWMLDWRGFKQRAPTLRARIVGLKFHKSDAASVARGIAAELRGTAHQHSESV